MKFFFNLLKPKDKEPPYDPAPLTNQTVSALFVGGVAVLVALYSTTTLRCSTQQKQVGCQTMNSVKDCDNLLLASCTTQCGGNPYYFCDGAISQHKQYNYYSYSCCMASRPVTETLGQCCGVLKETQICLTPQATVGVLGGYISLWLSVCQAIYTGLVLLYDFAAGKKKKDGPSKLGEDGSELVVSARNHADAEEEALEVFEVKIRKQAYFTTNAFNGDIYKMDADGEVGDKVGLFVNGKAQLF